MAAPTDPEFEAWLSKKLISINPDVDLDVFVTYITGILETEVNPEDREESLVGLLAEISEEDTQKYCQEIAEKWEETFGSKKSATESKVDSFEDQVHKMVAKQQNIKVQNKTVSAEARARKEAILAQYGQVSEGEDEDDDEVTVGATAADDLARNVNALAVNQREQELREKMKHDHENKKQKDREDRERQKQKALDRKEAEKKRTQKGERRR